MEEPLAAAVAMVVLTKVWTGCGTCGSGGRGCSGRECAKRIEELSAAMEAIHASIKAKCWRKMREKAAQQGTLQHSRAPCNL